MVTSETGEEITESSSEKNKVLGKDLLSDYLRGISSKGQRRNEGRHPSRAFICLSHRFTY